MAVDQFLETYKNAMLNKKMINPLSSSNASVATPRLGIQNQRRGIQAPTTFGSKVPDWIDTRKSSAINSYMADKSERTTNLASDYADKAAGQVPTNEWGIVQDKMTNFSDLFNQQLSSIGGTGKAALATEEAKAQWQQMQNQSEMNAGYVTNWTPGASSNNQGAKAVSLAMTAYKNGTQYAWGGNSLTGGVDCSGLVQQVYKKLGINLPRSSYLQAKAGKKVSLSNLLPGDLVFYNTGGQDPNGIGTLSHVAIYIGNGQIVDARNSRAGIQVGSINVMGGAVMAVRPW